MRLVVAIALTALGVGSLPGQGIPVGAFIVRTSPSAPTADPAPREAIPGVWLSEYLSTLASTRPRLVTMSVVRMAGDIIASQGFGQRGLEVDMRSCRTPRYSYSSVARAITLCDEMVLFADSIARSGLRVTRDGVPTVATDPSTIADRFLTFAVLHEAGHALAHQLQITAIDGNEEAADAFAALVLLRSNLEPVVDDAGLWFTYFQHWLSSEVSGAAPDSTHAIRVSQRADRLRCFIRGHRGRRESNEDRRCTDLWALASQAWEPAMGVDAR